MASATTTFRLSDRDRRNLDRLGTELVCKQADVLRYGMEALDDDEDRRRQIRADNVALSFIAGLRRTYGENAVLELVDPSDPSCESSWRIGGELVDPEVIGIEVREQGDALLLDLVDRATGVGISRAAQLWDRWQDERGRRHAIVPLRDLWVYASGGTAGEPAAREMLDGRTAIQIEEDDGTLKILAIDGQGNTERLTGGDVPVAVPHDDLKPSIGIGVRRESKLGPHLGQGIGGKWELTGDLEIDRRGLITTLEQLLEQATGGDLDFLLDIEGPGSR